MSGKPEIIVTVLLTTGILLSYVTGNRWFILSLAVVVPTYLAYVRRESNLLSKSKFYDRDFLLMVAVAVAVAVVFRTFWDPRIGLIIMIILIPILAVLSERIRMKAHSRV